MVTINGRYPSAGTAPYYQSRRYDPVGMVTSVYEFIAGEKINFYYVNC